MKFEWDENKNQSNYEKHGIYFDEAVEVFKSDCLTWIDDRKNYGETREITIGEVSKNIVLVLVHTDRFGNIRIISARKANERERSKYYDYR
ncbi:BrnT family toxin [Thiospirochaeta perfilievii]|uniref:BrnT family toxin n=1 Tax=Thiospirochaeta perfilievii TaxID=252967 RepID=A0A5C1QCC4_9SPIO|nr:BrnT family toxin [Thiospirochaeta perfilievii]QEN04569.1 BrnT family toxin [Thiospirochaeta perfilievii]